MTTDNFAVVFFLISCAFHGSSGHWWPSGWDNEADCLVACTDTGFVCKWFIWRWLCVEADCGNPSPVTDGTVVTTPDTTYDSLAIYICDTGFGLSGSSPRTCQANETWSGTAPSCLKECGYLSAPTNGDVSHTGTVDGATATFSCDLGYEITAGTNPRTCQGDGTWSGSAVVCSGVDCGTPSSPTNGTVDTSSGTTFGDIVVFSCDSGFELDGCAYSVCLSDSSWGSAVPTCVPVDCGALADPANGGVTLPLGSLIGHTATYSCDAGFSLNGDESRCCQPDATWSGSAPTCVQECPFIDDIDFGDIFLSGQQPGDFFSLTCAAGFILNPPGSNFGICQPNGTWTTEVGTCDPPDCGALADPDDGVVTTAATTFENFANYSCDSGYRLNGCYERVCRLSGVWGPGEPECVPLGCSNLTDPTDGSVDTSSGVLIGNTATYACDPGYVLYYGSSIRYCLEDGTWSGSAPVCLKECPTLSEPSNGDLDSGDTVQDTTVTITCDRGFVVSGQASVTCTSSGTWDNTLGDCTRIDCGPITYPSGTVTTVPDTKLESEATISCPAGYYNPGDNYMTCLSTGQWSRPLPGPCTKIDCGAPESPCDGSPTTQSGTLLGASATFTCDDRHTRIGPPSATCTTTGEWSPAPPCCEITECPALGAIPFGDVDTSDGIEIMDVATYQCNTCWDLEGDPTRTCQIGGDWSGSEPTCTSPRADFLGIEYRIFNCPRSRGEAQTICSAYGASLVEIHSVAVQNFLADLLDHKYSFVNEWWTAGTDAPDEDIWHWANGDLFDGAYTNWGENQPNNFDGNENCMILRRDFGYTWWDRKCTEEHAFVCFTDII